MSKLQTFLFGAVAMLFIADPAYPAAPISHPASKPFAPSATGAGNSHAPVFSADGGHVAFASQANNLVTNDDLGPHLDLFVRDLVASNTVLVSVSTNGFGGANDNIGLYTLSSNGTVIAFETDANNLAPGDTNRWRDIYVRDLVKGVTRLLTPGANGPSSNPLISADGRRVIFESLASNLVTNDFNGTNDIFIHDLTTGVTELISVNAASSASPEGPSHSPSISTDGLTVAFVSHATNLVEGVTNKLGEVYARKVADGTTRWAEASHIPATHAGLLSTGAYQAAEPVLSRDGRFVAFKTSGQTARFDLHRPTNSVILSFTNDLAPNPYTAEQHFHDNPRLGMSTTPAALLLSADGRYLASGVQSNQFAHSGIHWIDFETLETNWLAVQRSGGGTEGAPHFITNLSPVTRMVVTNFDLSPALSYFSGTSVTIPLAMSRDGQRLFFLANPTNGVTTSSQMTVRFYSLELPDGSPRLFSTNEADVFSGPNLSGTVVALSDNGVHVAWDSPDDKFVADDLNRASDVFLRNMDTGETTLVSGRHPDLPDATARSSSRIEVSPRSLSADGRKLAFLSFDGNQSPNDTNRLRDIFVRDFREGTTINASVFPRGPNYVDYVDIGAWPSLSADGRYLVFTGDRPAGTALSSRTIFWRDLQAPTNRPIFSPNVTSAPVLDQSGRFIAFDAQAALDLNYPDANGASDVFIGVMPLEDSTSCGGGSARVVSLAWSRTQTGNGASFNPVFSPDSRWLLFESLSTVLLSQPLPAQTSGQLYARSLARPGSTVFDCTEFLAALSNSPAVLLSYATVVSSPMGFTSPVPLAGGGRNPRFSADSRYVFFESASGAVYRHDLGIGLVLQTVFFNGVAFTNYTRATNDLVCTNCSSPSPSENGRHVVYAARSTADGITNIYWKDMNGGNIELISSAISGEPGNGSSHNPLLSHDARFVVFASRASDLVPGDNNRATDIFVRDRWTAVTHCLSRNLAGTGTGNRVSSNPILSADGRTVAFQSFASDLVAGDYNDTRDVFVVTLGGPDTDGDSMEDDWELAYFATLGRDGLGDFDNDGANDLDEFRAGTNPSSDTSVLRILRLSTALAQSPSPSRTTVVLWSASPGKAYRVQRKAQVDDPWADVGPVITAGGTSASFTDTVQIENEAGDSHHFYRVILTQ